MLKNICRLDYKEQEREITLLCDNDVPIPVLKNALVKYCQFVQQIEDNVKAQQAQPAPDIAKVDVPAEEIQTPTPE